MKHTRNNEIDLLLRRLAKRGEVSPVLADSATKDRLLVTHLDADELSSYAEGVLPAAARARFTAHLADCFNCRKIVSELTMASGARIRENELETRTGVAFWQRFRALLSLPVLRYAVPALALFAVITVGIISFTQLTGRQSRRELVARNEAPSIPEAGSEAGQSQAVAEPADKASSIGEAKRVEDSESAIGASADKTAKAGEKGGASKTDLMDSTYQTQAKDSPKPGATSNVAAQPSFAPEPTAPPPAHTETVTTAEARKNEEAAKQDDAKLKVQSERDAVAREQRNERSRVGEEAEDKQEAISKSRKAAAAARGGEGLRTMEARRADGADAKKADEETETRAIAGRRFRRRGNAWIDTAYESSRPAITIVRDSEQYRALVADEPGIRTIAEQLHGEVVVVWKGRAYRIR
jgi:hypothetical protein